MTTNYLRLRRRTAVALLLALVASGAVVVSASEPATIRLQPGYNAVTWNGAEPYPISDFAETLVTQIHRWDPAGQEWLSHFVGRENATLPELHLLPRVQYLLVAEAKYELEVPDAVEGIDPHAALRFAAAPHDPLRFEAWWPNEDSPLEDLVVLRGEDRRLSVKAEIAGGVGEVSVWWMIDGRVNHAGLASDDVNLTPGGHDHGRLYAVDDVGQTVVVELPRVVRLPSLESLNLPEMQFGVVAYVNIAASKWNPDDLADPEFCTNRQSICVYTGNLAAAFAAIDLIAEAGFNIVRNQALYGWSQSSIEKSEPFIERFLAHGISILSLDYFSPMWPRAADVTLRSSTSALFGGNTRGHFAQNGPLTDPAHFGGYLGRFVAKYPQIRFWQLVNEPDLKFFFQAPDPVNLVALARAGALAAWYANPNAVIVGPGFSQNPFDADDARSTIELLDETLAHGLGDYTDIYDLHFYDGCSKIIGWDQYEGLPQMIRFIDAYRGVMAKHGQSQKHLWMTEIGVHSPREAEEEAECIVESMEYLDQRPDVNAAFIHAFLQGSNDLVVGSAGLVLAPFENGTFTLKPVYHAVKEYIANRRLRTTD